MIRSFRQSSGMGRQVLLTLALLAVVLRVLIPPGFMAAAPRNDLPFALVICTGQGAMVMASEQTLPKEQDRHPAPAKSSHDSPCIFAGHGLGAPPPALANPIGAAFVAYVDQPSPPASDLRPGRGLTGPPLPARGPPHLLS